MDANARRFLSPTTIALAVVGLSLGAVQYAANFGCGLNFASPSERRHERVAPEQTNQPESEQRLKVEAGGDSTVNNASTQNTSQEQTAIAGLTGKDITRMQYGGIAAVAVLGLIIVGLLGVAVMALWAFAKARKADHKACNAYETGRVQRLGRERHGTTEKPGTTDAHR